MGQQAGNIRLMPQCADDGVGNFIGPHHGPLQHREQVLQQPVVGLAERDVCYGFRKSLPIDVVLGIDSGGVPQGPDSFVDGARPRERESKIVICLCVAGPVGDGLLEARDGLAEAALHAKRDAQQMISLHMVGLLGQNALVVGLSLFQLTGLMMRQPELQFLLERFRPADKHRRALLRLVLFQPPPFRPVH